MFTGIISDVGSVAELEQRGDLRARIATKYRPQTIDLGASIACDGVCLTVIESGTTDDQHWFDVEISAETVSKTTIATWKQGRSLNLERALRLGDELGGHIVSGHVDGTAIITAITPDGDSTRVTFKAPDHLAKFIAPKGSVALNGTSLTVNGVSGAEFDVNFIPHTQASTTWGKIALDDMINLEIDTLARYVARLGEMQNT